jgi:hypothetical protein
MNLTLIFFFFVVFFLQEHVMSLPGKLSEEVAEGGDNFSTGQRQVKQVSSLYLNYIILKHITHHTLIKF